MDVVDGRWWFDNQSTRDRMEELGSELIMTVAAPEPGKTGKQKKNYVRQNCRKLPKVIKTAFGRLELEAGARMV